MEWKETLQEVLAREAMHHFKEEQAGQQEFFQHMSILTGVNDWSEDFLQCCYEKYLDKINKAGNLLGESNLL